MPFCHWKLLFCSWLSLIIFSSCSLLYSITDDSSYSLPNDAPLVEVEYALLELFHLKLFLLLHALNHSLRMMHSLHPQELLSVRPPLYSLDVFRHEIVIADVPKASLLLALFKPSHVMIQLKQSSGIFNDLFNADLDLLAETKLDGLKVVIAADSVLAIQSVFILFVILWELGCDSNGATSEGEKVEIQVVTRELP